MKVAGLLARTERLVGCCVIVGATAGNTVKAAAEETTLFTGLEIKTVKLSPLSADVRTGVVYEEFVAPEIAAPLSCH